MSYNVEISRETTMEIFSSISPAKNQREATENYEKVLKEEAMSLAKEVKYQIEKASRSGKFLAVVEIKPSEISAWSPIDLKYYMRSILTDLGYKVWLPNDELYKLVIEW